MIGVGLLFAIGSVTLAAEGQPLQGSRKADGGIDPQAEARAAMREGLAAFDANEYEAALSHFRRATELVPEANLPHRHAARTLEALGRWDDAVAEHEAYLRIKPDVSDAQAVRDRIAEIRRTQLTGTLTLACDPPPSDVIVDGRIVTLGPARDVQLSRGPHHVRVQAPGFVSREIDVVVPGGGSVAPECTMARMTLQPVPGLGLGFGANGGPTRGEEPRSTPWYGRWYTWAGAGAVVTGAVLATILIARGTTPPPATEGGDHSFP